jgi:phage gp29-like protein
MPTVIASTPNNITDAEAQNLMDTLIQMQDQNTIVTGGNLDIRLHENNKAGNVELYRELINICNAEISKVILSETLTTEIKTGSYAAARTHQEIRKDVVESDLSLIEKNINVLISYICELNFGEVTKPEFVFER